MRTIKAVACSKSRAAGHPTSVEKPVTALTREEDRVLMAVESLAEFERHVMVDYYYHEDPYNVVHFATGYLRGDALLEVVACCLYKVQERLAAVQKPAPSVAEIDRLLHGIVATHKQERDSGAIWKRRRDDWLGRWHDRMMKPDHAWV